MTRYKVWFCTEAISLSWSCVPWILPYTVPEKVIFVRFGRREAAAIFLSSESWYRAPGSIVVHVHYHWSSELGRYGAAPDPDKSHTSRYSGSLTKCVDSSMLKCPSSFIWVGSSEGQIKVPVAVMDSSCLTKSSLGKYDKYHANWEPLIHRLFTDFTIVYELMPIISVSFVVSVSLNEPWDKDDR